MRLLTAWILGLMMFFSSPLNAFAFINETTSSAVIEARPMARAFVVRVHKERFLLTTSAGCSDQLRKRTFVTLATHGALDGYRDRIRTSPYYSCSIVTAYRISHALQLNQLYADKRSAQVTDERGRHFYIRFGDNCRRITAFRNAFVYAQQANDGLSKGDVLMLPGNLGRCTVLYSDPLSPRSAPSGKPLLKRPAPVSRVRAIPGNKKVFLYWHPANDDAIDHYLVGVSRYPIHSRRYRRDADDAFRVSFTTRKNKVWVTGLLNERTYYFYVKAVDRNGNTSSLWSLPASARTSSAIADNPLTTDYAPHARRDGTPTAPNRR